MADNVKIQQVPITFEYREETLEPYRPTRLVWEMDDRVDDLQVSDGVVRIRRYPYTLIQQAPPMSPQYDQNGYISGYSYGAFSSYNYGVNLQVSQGSLTLTGEIRQKFISETVFIAGQESVDLPYPVMAGLRFYILGVWYNVYGQPLWTVDPVGTPLTIPWPIFFDMKSQRLTFGTKVFGQLKYEYWTDYQIYRYFPTYIGDYEFFCTSGGDQYGHIMTFPQIVPADRAPEVAIFSIQPPQQLNLEFELYRLVSEGVVNKDGLWEKPNDFPNQGSFPSSSEVLDYTQGYVLIQRVHEIGYCLLHDQQRQARNAKSTDFAAMPIDLSQENLRGTAQSGGKIQTLRTRDGFVAAMSSNQLKAPKDYFRNVKDIPRMNMRTQRYEVKPAKPYDTENTLGKPSRYVIQQTISRYGNTIEEKYIEKTQQFKIKLKLVLASEPTYDGQTRVQENINDVSYNAQASNVNALFRKLWQAIDWQAIGKMIRASYPTSIYELDLSALNQFE